MKANDFQGIDPDGKSYPENLSGKHRPEAWAETQADDNKKQERADMAEIMHDGSGHCLVVDSSFGSTVGIVGGDPLCEADSRMHVERLEPNIAQVVADAGLTPQDLGMIVVGVGPAPFTGLRAGIASARALAFALDIPLLGQDILEPQAAWQEYRRHERLLVDSRQGEGGEAGLAGDSARQLHLTLAVNDARRKQLYYALYQAPLFMPEPEASLEEAQGGRETVEKGLSYRLPWRMAQAPKKVLERDIASADDIAAKVAQWIDGWREGLSDALPGKPDVPSGKGAGEISIQVDVVGHGAGKYASSWEGLRPYLGEVRDQSLLGDGGREGLALFAQTAFFHRNQGDPCPTDPLYLRRPDISLPPARKHALGQTGISLTLPDAQTDMGGDSQDDSPSQEGQTGSPSAFPQSVRLL